MASKKIHAYRKDTGERVTIPASWLDHPTLGVPFRKTKPSDVSASKSATSSTPASAEKGK